MNFVFIIKDTDKGRAIRKVMGGWGKTKKNSCKGKRPKKKFMHKMGLILVWTYNSFCQSAQVVSPVFKKLEIFWGSARML